MKHNKKTTKWVPGGGVLTSAEAHCVWMKAGVVNFKLCENAFDCLSCRFDKAMMKAAGQRPEMRSSWGEAMREKPYPRKECRHMLTGRVSFHLCSNSYRCHVCEFDQSLEEADLAVPRGTVHVGDAAGFLAAEHYYYHRGHTWARVEHGGLVRIGMDDFAGRLTGRLTGIKLPALGSTLEQTTAALMVCRDEHEARMLAPLDGVVVAANHRVLENPDGARKDPYGQGWLLVVEPRNLKQNLKNLLFDEEVRAWLQVERERLEAMASKVYPMPVAATGGEVVRDIYGSLAGSVTWEDLVHEFLLT